MLSAEDRLAIRELLALYGYIIDERQFSRVRELFTADARYDVSDFGKGVLHGPDAIAAGWSSPAARHPLAHYAVDVIITEDGDGTARVVCKGLGLRPDGGMGAVTYRDIVTKSAAGWRIAERVATRRQPDRIPEIS
jgi:SnoaL-like domain